MLPADIGRCCAVRLQFGLQTRGRASSIRYQRIEGQSIPPGEAFSRVKIDEQLRDVGWNLTDGRSVRYEYQLPDGTRADYVLADRHGRAMAVIEAKRASVNPVEAEGQAVDYASQADVPFVFLATVRSSSLTTPAPVRQCGDTMNGQCQAPAGARGCRTKASVPGQGGLPVRARAWSCHTVPIVPSPRSARPRKVDADFLRSTRARGWSCLDQVLDAFHAVSRPSWSWS